VIVAVEAKFTVRLAVDSSNPLRSPACTTVTGTGPLPKVVDPDLKVTVPEGEIPTLPPLGLAALCVSTNAVSMTEPLTGIEVALELIEVVVGPRVTVNGTAVETALAL